MNKLSFPNFNSKTTLLGGQSFTWDEISENEYIGFTQDIVMKLKFERNCMYWQTSPKKNEWEFIKQYFWLDVNYNQILKIISQDQHVKTAIKVMPDIRILRQPFDLTVISFILSANNNIPSIRRSIRNLCEIFGEKITVEGKTIVLFPKTEVLAKTPVNKLKEAKVGFRAKYIKKTARILTKTKLSEEIFSMNEYEARKTLIALPGVGNKIADCVLIFALGFENVTPIDVWARRFLVNLYELPENWKYEEMRQWIKRHFCGYASWAAQFLFEWYRTQNKKIS